MSIIDMCFCNTFGKLFVKSDNLAAANDKTRINVIFMAHFNYPHGMAATNVVQNYIEYIHDSPGFDVQVLVLRQERVKLADSELSGEYKGVRYMTIGNDIRPGAGVLIKGPKFFLDGIVYLKKSYRKNHKNIIYVYGNLNTDNFLMILYAKMAGYKVVFYIVEDVEHQSSAPDFFARLRSLSARIFCGLMWMFTDAAMVVSTRLLEKMKTVSKGRFPVAINPITVDFRHFDSIERAVHEEVRIFYAGTFNEKDGVKYLIAGFEDVCKRNDNVNLILTGKGGAKDMEEILERIASSDFRQRIFYKGYLPEDEYYSELYNSDILCMTRTSSAFANAGFPYKLGEYLATGIPVIATDVSDIGLYLEDKTSAVIIEPDSPQAVAEAIEYLIADRVRAEKIGARGKEVARQKFDVRVAGQKFKKMLLDL